MVGSDNFEHDREPAVPLPRQPNSGQAAGAQFVDSIEALKDAVADGDRQYSLSRQYSR